MQLMLSTERDNLVFDAPEQIIECLIRLYADARKKEMGSALQTFGSEGI